MKVEYEAQVSDDVKEFLERILDYVEDAENLEGRNREVLFKRLNELLLLLERPIIGTVEVEPEDVEPESW